jgi:hypothetical protein
VLTNLSQVALCGVWSMRDTRGIVYPELQDTEAAAEHALAFAMLKSRKAEKKFMNIDPPSLSLRDFTFMLQHNVFLLGMLFCGTNGDFRTVSTGHRNCGYWSR